MRWSRGCSGRDETDSLWLDGGFLLLLGLRLRLLFLVGNMLFAFRESFAIFDGFGEFKFVA